MTHPTEQPTTLRFICPQCRTHYFKPMKVCDWCDAVPVVPHIKPSRDQFGRLKV